MVTWVWPWGQFHWSESESLLAMSMSRGLFGMFLSGGSPGSGGLLFMSMFMGLLGISVSGGLVGMSVSGGLIGMSVSGGLSSRFTICVSWVASFMSVSLWFVIALLRSMSMSGVVVHSVIICSCVSWYCLHHLQERSGFVVFMFFLIFSIYDLVLKIIPAKRLGSLVM